MWECDLREPIVVARARVLIDQSQEALTVSPEVSADVGGEVKRKSECLCKCLRFAANHIGSGAPGLTTGGIRRTFACEIGEPEVHGQCRTI